MTQAVLTHFVDQVGHELRDSPASDSQELRLKVSATTPSFYSFLLQAYKYLYVYISYISEYNLSSLGNVTVCMFSWWTIDTGQPTIVPFPEEAYLFCSQL